MLISTQCRTRLSQNPTCVFLVRPIFFCSCSSPYSSASAVGGQPGTVRKKHGKTSRCGHQKLEGSSEPQTCCWRPASYTCARTGGKLLAALLLALTSRALVMQELKNNITNTRIEHSKRRWHLTVCPAEIESSNRPPKRPLSDDQADGTGENSNMQRQTESTIDVDGDDLTAAARNGTSSY